MNNNSEICASPLAASGPRSRAIMLATVSLFATAMNLQSAHAAEADAAAESATAAVEEVVVTGSRIVRDGYNAPTPVSVVGAAEIQALAPANLADFVNTLPSIAGSTTPASSSPSLSAGSAGINAVNLRNLGTGRTLVLIDGQRSVASTAGGVVDINTIPQGLVDRVEVVTGGASAAYGSDAVGGVINFILKKNFEGARLKLEYGETTYGDGQNYKYTLTGGKKLFDGKLRLMGNAEYARTEGINSVPRDWNTKGYFNIKNPAYTATNGQPENYVGYGIGPAQVSPGGLITAGPLTGTYFSTVDPATGRATVGQLAFGPKLGQWMIGGDWKYTGTDYFGSESLLPGEIRWGLFGRADYDVTDHLTLFAQGAYNKSIGLNYYIQTTNIANVNIRTDNPYIPTSLRPQILAAYPGGTFQIGSTNNDFPVGGANNRREVLRFVAGAKGDVDLFARNWKWDFYYQRGESKLHEELINTYSNARFNLAADPVAAPAGNAAGIAAGTIVCRSTLTAPTNGCVPLNRLGIGVASQAALDYIFYENPYRDQKLVQQVAALTVSGDLFELPAGKVAVAFGGEIRKEEVSGSVRPEFGPSGTVDPSCASPTGTRTASDGKPIPCTSAGWLYGNYVPNVGSYNVKEAFVEVDVPVIEGLNVNAAGRVTDYSTSGQVETWKVGATYQVIEDLKLRGTVSHDIRAPNLEELFAGGTGRSNNVLIKNRSYAYVQFATGNPDLKPEIADGFNVGFVATPRWTPGLTFAVDYYEIKIKKAIGSLQPQDVADLCYEQRVTAQCPNIIGTFDPVTGLPITITRILLKPFNFASQTAQGLDLEAAYRIDLEDIYANLPGSLTVRAMATHYLKNYQDRGIGTPTDNANSSTLPDWLYRVSATYTNDAWTYNLTARGIDGTSLSNEYIGCTTACPRSTPTLQTINDNTVPGAIFFDGAVSWDFESMGRKGELQLSVRNLFDKDPPNVGNLTSSASTAAFPQSTRFFDQLGRVYKVALTIDF